MGGFDRMCVRNMVKIWIPSGDFKNQPIHISGGNVITLAQKKQTDKTTKPPINEGNVVTLASINSVQYKAFP
jgi:hypothetical protein